MNFPTEAKGQGLIAKYLLKQLWMEVLPEVFIILMDMVRIYGWNFFEGF